MFTYLTLYTTQSLQIGLGFASCFIDFLPKGENANMFVEEDRYSYNVTKINPVHVYSNLLKVINMFIRL